MKITRLDGKVIDFWENEFGGISPVVNKAGEKFYTRQDIELILKIKHLMIVEKMEKSEIKKIIREANGHSIENNHEKRIKSQKIMTEKLKIIRTGLEEILTLLDKNGK